MVGSSKQSMLQKRDKALDAAGSTRAPLTFKKSLKPFAQGRIEVRF